MSTDNIPLPEQTFGPGDVLRKQREKNEWSVEAVAEALHLSSASVKAIEANRYDDLPVATYVIGYWRSYARLLNINIEDTIEANKSNLNIITPESRGLDVSQAYQYKKGMGNLLWLLLLILIGTIGYFIWQQNFFGLRYDELTIADEPLSEDNVIVNDKIDNVTDFPSTLTQVLRPLNLQKDNNLSDIESPLKTIFGAEQSAQNETLTQTAQASTVETPKAANIAPTGVNSSQTSEQVSKASTSLFSAQNNIDNSSVSTLTNTPIDSEATDTTNAAPLKKQTTATTDTNDTNGFVLHLSKNSWLDVRDKSNKRIIYKTEVAGSKIKLKGEAPFYVYIGTPSGVTITHNGKQVTFDTHKSGLFARFKLGKTAESL